MFLMPETNRQENMVGVYAGALKIVGQIPLVWLSPILWLLSKADGHRGM